MTTQTEALKLALEALEDIKGDCSGCEFEWSNDYPLQAKAHAAIKEALAQPEQEPYGYLKLNTGKFVNDVEGLNPMTDKRYLPLYTTPPQPEQEPVAHPFEDKSVISSLSWAAGLIEQAYRECGGHNGADSWLMNYADKQGERIRQADHREWEKVNGRWQVKVTPPQRTWVGLTELEAVEFVKTMERGNFLVAIYDIEKKLKEKNT